MARDIQVLESAVSINGINTPIDDVINAEASIVHDWTRVAVILVVALLGPIFAMVVAVQLDGSRLLGMSFGPVLLVATVILGLLGCVIGIAWKKPWGVIVERKEFGHSTLLVCESCDEAESIAARIRETVSARS